MGNPNKLAIVLTGAPRALRETIDHIEMSLSQCDFDLFIAIDTDDPKYEDLLRARFGEKVVLYQQVRKCEYDSELASMVKSRLPEYCNVHSPALIEGWRVGQYLCSSGSIIEFKQIEVAMSAVIQVDQERGGLYSCMVRVRADYVPTESIVNPTLIPDESITVLKERIARTNPEIGTDSVALLASSLTHPVRSMMREISSYQPCVLPCQAELPITHMPDPTKSLSQYLSNGNFLIAFHMNTTFYAGRRAFEPLRDIYSSYAERQFKPTDPDWVRRCPNWWDAEHQLQFACIDNDILYTNTYLPMEAENGPHPEAFNEDFTKLLPNNPNACFFFWRHCVPP